MGLCHDLVRFVSYSNLGPQGSSYALALCVLFFASAEQRGFGIFNILEDISAIKLYSRNIELIISIRSKIMQSCCLLLTFP